MFLDYVDTRPQLLAGWEDRLVIDDSDYADTEMWQRRLWLTMFGPGGLLERRLSSDTNFNRWRLPTALLMSIKPSELKLPSQLHFFGFPYLPRSVPPLLDHLAEACNVFVYILAPGAESRSHPKQWELPGREHVALLRSLPQCQVSSEGEATPAAARVEILVSDGSTGARSHRERDMDCLSRERVASFQRNGCASPIEPDGRISDPH